MKQQISVEVDAEDVFFKLENRFKWGFLIKEGIKAIQARREMPEEDKPEYLRTNIAKLQARLTDLHKRIIELEERK